MKITFNEAELRDLAQRKALEIADKVANGQWTIKKSEFPAFSVDEMEVELIPVKVVIKKK